MPTGSPINYACGTSAFVPDAYSLNPQMRARTGGGQAGCGKAGRGRAADQCGSVSAPIVIACGKSARLPDADPPRSDLAAGCSTRLPADLAEAAPGDVPVAGGALAVGGVMPVVPPFPCASTVLVRADRLAEAVGLAPGTEITGITWDAATGCAVIQVRQVARRIEPAAVAYAWGD